ncbi:hypothetical protein OIDMADRAFT_47156 [Oidiodendron maius Zn]|uniref:Extracellular membrane protein CFEM domain-containing protein n=1 Tax=Oidiodendron maius (strain Zn) TaxID=913774 RepID=A0A0C3D7C8_OIDMZ|nr:hypothetical protein OIDMADRAFT_47156 [Oidiodendron maius Zn]
MQGSNYIADILVLFFVASCAAQSVDTSTVTLTAQPAFSVQPACVQSCLFWEFGDVVDYLLFGLGCTSTIYNECYCTQIVDQSAQTILSTCVHTLCSGTTEISNAISLIINSSKYYAFKHYPNNNANEYDFAFFSRHFFNRLAKLHFFDYRIIDRILFRFIIFDAVREPEPEQQK